MTEPSVDSWGSAPAIALVQEIHPAGFSGTGRRLEQLSKFPQIIAVPTITLYIMQHDVLSTTQTVVLSQFPQTLRPPAECFVPHGKNRRMGHSQELLWVFVGTALFS